MQTCRRQCRFWNFAGAAELSEISDDPRDAVCDEKDMQGVQELEGKMKRCSECKHQTGCQLKWEYGALYCNEYEEAEQVPAKQKEVKTWQESTL